VHGSSLSACGSSGQREAPWIGLGVTTQPSGSAGRQ
jgi:hypothetical protein